MEIILIGIIILLVSGITYINNKDFFHHNLKMDISQEISTNKKNESYTDTNNIKQNVSDALENDSENKSDNKNKSNNKNTSSNKNEKSTNTDNINKNNFESNSDSKNKSNNKNTSSNKNENSINNNNSNQNNEKENYACLNGYTLDIEKKECYQYEIIESSKTKKCPDGYKIYITDELQEKCRKYIINDDVMIFSNPHCVDERNVHQELSIEDNACLDPDDRINKPKEECESLGYFWSKAKNYCYFQKANIMYYKSCGSGYKMSDSTHCYRYDIIDMPVVKVTCPDGFTLSDDKNFCSYKFVMKAFNEN